MPGRPSKRSSAAAYLSSKSSNQALTNSRRVTASATTSIPDEGRTSNLRNQISAIFNDAQRGTAGHRKLIVGMRKIQEECICEPPVKGKKVESQVHFVENDFNVEFSRCVIRLMVVKKNEVIGDRLVRFVGLFLSHASKKGKIL